MILFAILIALQLWFTSHLNKPHLNGPIKKAAVLIKFFNGYKFISIDILYSVGAEEVMRRKL